jgi:lipopolysaccharide export system permease protein
VPVLFKYLARHYLRLVGLTLGALVLIYLVSEVFSKFGKFSAHRPEAAAMIAYFALRLPRAAYEVLPLAALTASVLAVSVLSRQHEITALRACGVGLSRIVSPIVATALLLGLTAFAANWSLIPTATADAQRIKDVRIEGRPHPSMMQRDRLWMRLERRTFLNVRMADPASRALLGVRLYQVGDAFNLTREIDAPRVNFDRGSWIAINGLERFFDADGSIRVERFAERRLDLANLPADFSQLEVKEEHLNYPRLRSYVANLERSGIDPGRYAVDVASRLSVPFVTVVMAVLGIPFGLVETRRGGWGLAVGISLFLGLSYWMVYSLTISLGRGGLLSPLVAAWAANLLFLAVGAALLIQKRH